MCSTAYQQCAERKNHQVSKLHSDLLLLEIQLHTNFTPLSNGAVHTWYTKLHVSIFDSVIFSYIARAGYCA